MRITLTIMALTTLVLVPGSTATAQEDGKEKELIKYSIVEINDLLANFKATYKSPKVPEEDAQNVLTGLKDAYLYLDSKGDEATKEELKAKKQITKLVSKGLFARRRPRVNVECARALGAMGDPDAAKPLAKWMDDVVLDAKAPNSDWVEYGFRSLAWVGGTKSKTLDFVLGYATGKHNEVSVASQALMAMSEWRLLPGKSRKEWFNKVNQYMAGLYSLMRGTDQKKRGDAEREYNAIKETGLQALSNLGGVQTPFADPDTATKWWNDGNKRRKWDDYVGPRFREKAASKKTDAGKPDPKN